MTVKQLESDDGTGILKNITEVLEEHRAKNLKAIVLCYERSDGSIRTFWNGNVASCNYLMDHAKYNLFESDTVEHEATYDKSLDDD